jgi:hypothetical protein
MARETEGRHVNAVRTLHGTIDLRGTLDRLDGTILLNELETDRLGRRQRPPAGRAALGRSTATGTKIPRARDSGGLPVEVDRRDEELRRDR